MTDRVLFRAELPFVQELRERAQHLDGLVREVEQIARDCALPVVQLPNIAGGLSGPDDLLRLGRDLLSPPSRLEESEAPSDGDAARERAS